MGDNTRQTPETDAEKIATMQEFEGHCGPIHFTKECTAKEYIATIKETGKVTRKMFAERLARILIKKTT